MNETQLSSSCTDPVSHLPESRAMKALGWIAAVVPVVAVVVFYRASPPVAKTSTSTQLASKEHSSAPASPDKPKAQSASKADYVAKKRREAAILSARADEHFAKAAAIEKETSTPERQRELVDAKMRSREPSYRDLFASWSIDSGEATKVLKIIRDREAQVMRTKSEFLKRTLNANKYHVERNTDEALAELKLNELLTSKQLEELFQLESRLSAEEFDRGQKVVNAFRQD